MKLNRSKFVWIPKKSSVNDQLVSDLHQQLPQFSRKFIELSVSRGLTTRQEILDATEIQPQHFHNPSLLYQMDLAVERIMDSINRGSPILIYGDYDADGITSTLILLEALESMGANVHYYLPNRLIDGYGPNLERWNQLIEEYQLDLIITVDNGVAGHEVIEATQAKGVDVIVTDHHELSETLPLAFAVIHPKHPKGNYPFADLSGAGVALKLANALLGEIPIESLELAAIGTVADMVSLTDENRTIVLSGLNLLKNTLRPGLIHLFEQESISSNKIDSDTIGFIIGPRLNAIGRLGDPSPALEWLRTLDDEDALSYLSLIESKNQERRAITKNISEIVMDEIKQLEKLPNIILAQDQTWTAGVLGIVAGQITNHLQRPTILFQYLAEEEVYRGSGRSIEGINLFEALTHVQDYILYFGGHSQAAGLTVEESHWEDFNHALNTYMAKYQEDIYAAPIIKYDMELEIGEITLDFINEINLLAPFGTNNPRPIFSVKGITVKDLRIIGNDQTHLKITMQDEQNELAGIGFGMAGQGRGIQAGDNLSVVGELNLNEWRDIIQPQLMMKDLGSSGSIWIDVRGSQVDTRLFQVADALLVYRNRKILEKMSQQFLHRSTVIYGELMPSGNFQNLIIMEPPTHLSQLQELLNNYNFENIYLGSYVNQSKYLAGDFKREEFTRLYQFIVNNKTIDYSQEMQGIAEYLKIPYVKLRHMFLVFYEAGFVTMESSRLLFNQNSQDKVELTKLKSFHDYQGAFKGEALLNYQPIQKIKEYFEET